MSALPTILVTGANGQLGMELRDIAPAFSQFNFLFTDKEKLSIDDETAVENFFSSNTIFACINCAAYTAVDKAETDRELATSINATGVGFLARACKKYAAQFIHISTDYVFAGDAKMPYLPDDKTNPVNFYGQTKLQGEEEAISNYAGSIIIRTSWVYSRHGKNFVKTMLRLMDEKDSIAVVADQFGCPTYAADLAAAIMQIISSGNFVAGTYHFCNEGIISWFDFATAIAQASGAACVVRPIEKEAYHTPAARPAYSALDTEKFSATFHVRMQPWRQSLQACVDALKG